MLEVVQSLSEDLLAELEESQPDNVEVLEDQLPLRRISCLRYSVHAPPDLFEYTKLVDACCAAAQPVVEMFWQAQFSAWLFLVGAVLTKERRVKFENYSLPGPAKQAGLLNGKQVEMTFDATEGDRAAGLYRISSERFCAACGFINRKLYPLIILSKRTDFATIDTIGRLHEIAAYDGRGKPTNALNWRAVALSVCPRGDVVVRVDGAFDDLDRVLNFIYVNDVLEAESIRICGGLS
jgi:hypothetical protein